jgi:hypothetical protein
MESTAKIGDGMDTDRRASRHLAEVGFSGRCFSALTRSSRETVRFSGTSSKTWRPVTGFFVSLRATVVIFLENASGEHRMPITRRHFLQQGAAAAVALATTPSLLADPLGLPIGCQTYPVRHSINPDFAGTMKGLSAAGFQTIELCSPFGYKEFSSLAQYKPQELRRMLHDYGLTCISSHFDTDELFNHAEERIAWAKDLA